MVFWRPLAGCITRRLLSCFLVFLLLAGASQADTTSGGADKELFALHLTDLHIDLKYKPGSEVACEKPPCCRTGADPSRSIQVPAGAVGEYNCDTRIQVLQSALDAVSSGIKPDLVIWTGDTAPHHAGTTKEDVLESIAYVSRELARRLPGVPVFPSLGNHDFVPVHSDPGPPLNSWLLHPLSELTEFGAWLDADALETFSYAGYYEAKVTDTLSVVGLNTQMCHVRNLFQFVDDTLGREQLAWLEGVLKRAMQSGRRVLVTGHIPPGMFGGCWGRASRQFEELLNKYVDVVAGQLYGHQHSGSFRIFRKDSEYFGPPIAVAQVTPGFTPYKARTSPAEMQLRRGGNPTFRLYTLSPEPTWTISDFKQFFLPLHEYESKAIGVRPVSNLNWVFGYSPLQAFNMTDMSAMSWQRLRDRFDSEKELLARFQQAEASGRSWQGPGEKGDYLCGTSHVADGNLQECIGTNEEILVRKYTASTHTYVITAMFPFDSVLDYFCPILQGIHPSDCPPRLYDGGHIPDLLDVAPDFGSLISTAHYYGRGSISEIFCSTPEQNAWAMACYHAKLWGLSQIAHLQDHAIHLVAYQEQTETARPP